MYRVRESSRRSYVCFDMLRLSNARGAIVAAFIAIVLGVMSPSGPAAAQVGDTSAFMPRAWQAGGGDVRPGARARSSRRHALSTSTALDEFDVPRRSSTASRIVERRRSGQRAVRVAAIQRTPTATYVDASPARGTAVKKKAKRTASNSMAGGLRSMMAPQPSLTGGGIAWRASSACLSGNLRSIMSVVASRYGGVTVNSTCRSPGHNRRVGGASKSWHLTGNAVDFRVRTASIGSLSGYLRSLSGGFKHYGGGRYHIDNGPKRSF
jgi:hypothetical protein